MTNEFNGGPMGRHAQQPRVNQVASQLSESLPVVNVEDTAPQYTGNPVITFEHVTKVYEAQPNKPALNDVSLAHLSLVNSCSSSVILGLGSLRSSSLLNSPSSRPTARSRSMLRMKI